MQPHISAFFDPTTFTYSYVVADPETSRCALIDTVLDYDPSSGHTSYGSADRLIEHVQKHNLQVEWILETHAHADHLSAAPYLKEQLGGKIAIGERITLIQETFGKLFNAGDEFATDGRQFDTLFADGESFSIGNLTATVMHTPGHTPACVSYLIGDALFVGDTLFMPDYGTARCDFPGGDAAALFDSIQKIYQLPDETRLLMCHDYGTEQREEYLYTTTVAEQKQNNVQLNAQTSRDAFVQLRTQRDAQLAVPKLLLPAVQINMRAGYLPPAEANGTHYLKIPLNVV